MAKREGYIKEKMMTKFPSFQAGFAAASVRSGALVIALIVPASPAHAEVVTLVCEAQPGSSLTLRIDYDEKTASLINGDGAARFFAPANITDAQVWWRDENAAQHNGYAFKFEGVLNRLSGDLFLMYPDRNGMGGLTYSFARGPCRRATQKF